MNQEIFSREQVHPHELLRLRGECLDQEHPQKRDWNYIHARTNVRKWQGQTEISMVPIGK